MYLRNGFGIILEQYLEDFTCGTIGTCIMHWQLDMGGGGDREGLRREIK